jgi:hypothetical protein
MTPTTPQKPVARTEKDETSVDMSLPPVDPRGLQSNEAGRAPLTTNPPRGVGEAPSNQIADEVAAADLQKHVQKTLDDEEKRGFRGQKRKNRVPNENYTLKGVGQGLPTPETTVYTPDGH